MKNYKKILITLIFSLTILVPISASLITLDWQWEANDSEVTTFRYKLNDDAWVVVDPSITQFVLTGVDGGVSYSFEVQQSYDGINYSESAIQTYLPPVEEPQIVEPAIVIQEPVIIENAPEVVKEPIIEEPIIEEPIIEEQPVLAQEPVIEEVPVEIEQPKKVEKLTPISQDDTIIEALDSNPWMAVEFLLGTGGKGDNYFLTSAFDPDGNYQPIRTMILPSATFDFIYGNIITLSPVDSFNLRAGVGFNLYEITATNTTVIGSDVHVGLVYNRKMNEKITLTSGLGLSLMFTTVDISTAGAPVLFYGPYISVGMRYQISDIFALVANAETKLLFSDAFTPYELTGIVRVGFTYRF